MGHFNSSISTSQNLQSLTEYANFKSSLVYNLSTDLTSADLIDPLLLVHNTLETPSVLGKSKNIASAQLESNKSICNDIQPVNSPAMLPSLELAPDLVFEKSFESEQEKLYFDMPGLKSSEDIGKTRLSMSEETVVPRNCGFDIFTAPAWKFDGIIGQLEGSESQSIQNECQPAFTFPVVKQSILSPVASPAILGIPAGGFNLVEPDYISYANFSKNISKDNFFMGFDMASEVFPKFALKGKPSMFSRSSTATVNSLPTTSKSYRSYGPQPKEPQTRKNKNMSYNIDATKVAAAAFSLAHVPNPGITPALLDLSNKSISKKMPKCKCKSKKGRPPVHGTDEERFAARRLANRKYYLSNKDKINKRRKKRKTENDQIALNEELEQK
jgi:hypothetical protein